MAGSFEVGTCWRRKQGNRGAFSLQVVRLEFHQVKTLHLLRIVHVLSSFTYHMSHLYVHRLTSKKKLLVTDCSGTCLFLTSAITHLYKPPYLFEACLNSFYDPCKISVLKIFSSMNSLVSPLKVLELLGDSSRIYS